MKFVHELYVDVCELPFNLAQNPSHIPDYSSTPPLHPTGVSFTTELKEAAAAKWNGALREVHNTLMDLHERNRRLLNKRE